MSAKRRRELIAAIRKDWEVMFPPYQRSDASGYEVITEHPHMIAFRRRVSQLEDEIGDHKGELSHRRRWYGAFKSELEFSADASVRGDHHQRWKRIQSNLAVLKDQMA